jgi:GT2 family glycosyltransferase
MKVRIGIVSWNTAGLLSECLAALPAAAESLDYDVVVVDNHSADNSVEVARGFEVTTVANQRNMGYASGMNQALTLVGPGDGTQPDVFIALNPDTVAQSGSLTTLVRTLEDDPTLGLVVPKLTNADGSLQHTVFRFPTALITSIICLVPSRLQRGWIARRWWLEGRVPHDTATDIDWAIGAVHVLRSDAVRDELPYCERWFMYVEDMDLCWRLHQRGWRCRLEPRSVVAHVGNAAGKQAWGASRDARWWAATYDWVRFRRGLPAARRYARVNTAGVYLLWQRARLAHRLFGTLSPQSGARAHEMRQIFPIHRAMAKDPAGAFPPEDSFPKD